MPGCTRLSAPVAISPRRLHSLSANQPMDNLTIWKFSIIDIFILASANRGSLRDEDDTHGRMARPCHDRSLAGMDQAVATIIAVDDVTYDFVPVSGTLSPALTPADVRVGRTAPGRLTVNGGSRLRVLSGGGFDPGLIVARRAGSGGSAVLIDNGAIDLSGSDLFGGVFVHVGRDSFGRMTIRNGGELNLINPDLGSPDESGAGLSVGRSIGGGELLLDNGSVLLDSTDSSIAIGREGATAGVTVRNGSTIAVLDDGPVDTTEGSRNRHRSKRCCRCDHDCRRFRHFGQIECRGPGLFRRTRAGRRQAGRFRGRQ